MPGHAGIGPGGMLVGALPSPALCSSQSALLVALSPARCRPAQLSQSPWRPPLRHPSAWQRCAPLRSLRSTRRARAAAAAAQLRRRVRPATAYQRFVPAARCRAAFYGRGARRTVSFWREGRQRRRWPWTFRRRRFYLAGRALLQRAGRRLLRRLFPRCATAAAAAVPFPPPPLPALTRAVQRRPCKACQGKFTY